MLQEDGAERLVEKLLHDRQIRVEGGFAIMGVGDRSSRSSQSIAKGGSER
jgi:hypothetical protein